MLGVTRSPPSGVRGPGEHGVDQLAGGAEVVADGLVPGELGHRALLGAGRRRARPSRVAAIRSGWTRSSVDQVGGLGAGDQRAAHEQSRSVSHSTCQAPSARSSTCSAAARCRVAASWGVVSAARRTSVESTGLALCGMVDEPPPTPSLSSPISGRDSVSTSLGDPAPGVGAGDQGVGDPGDRAPRGVPRRRVGQAERPAPAAARAAGRIAAQLDDGGLGAGGAADLHGEGQPARGRRRRRALRSARRGLEAERGRHGVLGQGARHHRGVPVRHGQLGQALGRAGAAR